MKDSIWVSKYAPKTFDDFIGMEGEDIKSLVGSSMPHLLFCAPPGCGKTAAAKIIIKQLDADALFINSSMDRGVDIIRNTITDFAKTKSLKNCPIKIVFLDEADGITDIAQLALKGVMDNYASYVRFILTANVRKKIIEPIQDSRCVVFEFKKPSIEAIKKRLIFILKEEKVEFEDIALDMLIDKFYPNIRQMINQLQKLTKNGKVALTKDCIPDSATTINVIIGALKWGSYEKAREISLKEDPTKLFKDFYEHLMTAYPDKREEIAKESAKLQFYMGGAIFPRIPLDVLLHKAMGWVK